MIVLVWVGVVLIGGAGSVLRFIIDGAVTSWTARSFPFGTLVVNLSGATLLGLTAGLALNHDEALLVGTAKVEWFSMNPGRVASRRHVQHRS